MIRLLNASDINTVSLKYGLENDYLNTLVNNMKVYMYLSVNEEIDGYMLCENDGKNIIVKSFKYNDNNMNDFIRNLKFNANRDVIIKTDDNNLVNNLVNYGYVLDNNYYVRKYRTINPVNTRILEYSEQSDEFKKELLNQINEPLWPGARSLYRRICENEHGLKVYIIYDDDNKHIITFASYSDVDEIYDTDLKPWIGCLYTFRPYRGNRYSEKIIKYILDSDQNSKRVYISSNHTGLYEKYGFEFKCNMKNYNNEETHVFEYVKRR